MAEAIAAQFLRDFGSMFFLSILVMLPVEYFVVNPRLPFSNSVRTV